MKANFTFKQNRNKNFRAKSKHFLFLLMFAANIFFTENLTGQDKVGTFTIQAIDDVVNSDWYVKLKVPQNINGGMSCFWGGESYSWKAYLNGSLIHSEDQWINAGFITPLLQSNGIDTTGTYKMYYYVKGNLGCYYYKESYTVTARTLPLKPPKSPAANDSTSLEALNNTIKVTWVKGTDVPDNIHHYYIARDNDFENKVHITGISPREWIDTDVGPGETHTYSIWTWVSSSKWGGHQSDTVSATGYTFSGFSASDGIASGNTQVKIDWPQMPAGISSVKILKEGVEIANITDMNATRVFYDDNEVIPGYKYNYSLVPYNGNVAYPAQQDTGYARPNGRIQGTVKAPFGGPVEGAIVYAECLDDLPQGENNTIYSDTTNSFGSFDIQNIYYHTGANFKVYAVKGNHGFNPASNNVYLDLNYPSSSIASPSFVDTSSFTVNGRVAQIMGSDTAAIKGAEILVNDVFKGTKTNNLGEFSLTVEEIGKYTFKPRFFEHAFTPAEITYQIESDTTGLFFEDTDADTLSGHFLGACDIYIGQASLRIFNSENPQAAFDTTIVTAENSGYYEIILPSRKYNIAVTDFVPDNSQNLNKDEVISFFDASEIDLTENSVQKDFIYRKAPEIEITGWPESGCVPYDVPIVEQIVKYPLEINVFESYGDNKCLTSAGYVVVYDEIKDGYTGGDTLQLDNGVLKYDLLPGEPNLLSGGEHPYQKKITVHAYVDGQTADLTQYVLVTGNKPREQTFATVSPEVPFLILRDPPGDESYSSLSKDISFNSSLSLYSQVSGSVNVWEQTKIGVEQEAGVGVFIPYKLWGQIKTSMEVGASLKAQGNLTLEFKTVNEFSTSGNEDITGDKGDVFVGSAMNMVYALTDVLSYDAENCGVDLSQKIIVAPHDFATTFMYTENHIRNVLIPQLRGVADYYRQMDSDSAYWYDNQISVWEQTLQANEDLKANAHFIENRSFSAGSGFSSSASITASTSVSLEFMMYVEQTVASEAGLEVGGVGESMGADVKFRMETGGSVSVGTSFTKTVGYTLKDNDLGDYFSVDIKEDPVYGTPVFGLVSGRSSCPWEPGTQPREGVQLTIDKPAVYNVEQDGQAVFKLTLGNTSQSDEDFTYNLVFLQESNPDGAILTLGGSEVQGGILTPYHIPAGETIDQTITVKRGPNANAYQNLKFVLLSGCGDASIRDTVSFSVYFQSSCSQVNISKPLDNWRINSSNNNILSVEISDYDLHNLDNIVQEYRNLASDTWEIAQIMDKTDLQNNATTIDWDVSFLDDGEYELRARLACGTTNQEYNYSDIITGRIDRAAPEVFGVPEPTDGNFDTGDVISVAFNEPLNCNSIGNNSVVLEDINTGTVYPAKAVCGGTEIVIVPLSNENFSNQSLMVSLFDVEDQWGNIRPDAVTWKFDVTNAEFVVDETDSDGDGFPDIIDNCSGTPNSGQEDVNGNGIGDACEKITAVENIETVNPGFTVYPNPASTEVSIDIDLPQPQQVYARLFNSNNIQVKILFEKTNLQSGEQTISANVQDLAAGLYFVQVVFEDGLQTKKLLIIK